MGEIDNRSSIIDKISKGEVFAAADRDLRPACIHRMWSERRLFGWLQHRSDRGAEPRAKKGKAPHRHAEGPPAEEACCNAGSPDREWRGGSHGRHDHR